MATGALSIEARPSPVLPRPRRGAPSRWRSPAATTLLFLGGGVGIWRSERIALVVISLALTAVLLLLFRELAFQALVAWVVLAPLAFAFARFPSQRPILTFDRAWIAGLAAAVVLSAPDRPAPRGAP
ncbi:MAG TPA: hypothetical protein VHF24_03805, partial [Acidimicrobiales bacterium]|nr:hypothetical protein [Acidimicrobiales bacterium]